MHRCLEIEELVRIIADHGRKGDVVRLACCRKSFYEPAMDSVWRELPDMMPLLRCLPKKFWVDGKYGRKTFTKCVFNPTDWVLFTQHARRVRVIKDPDEDDPHGLPEPCWDALREYANSGKMPIIPNLQELSLYVDGCIAFNYLFLHPHLHTIRLGYWQVEEDVMFSAMQDLERRHPPPSLTKLSISLNSKFQSALEKPLSSVVCSLGQLSVLTVNTTLSEDAICHLASLPCLTHLQFALSNTDYSRSSLARISGPKFVALVELKPILPYWLDSDGNPSAAASLASFLNAAAPPRLAQIHTAEAFILWSGEEEDTPGWQLNGIYLPQLFTALARVRVDTLTHLSIDLGYELDPKYEWMETPECVVDDEILSPLLKLENLRSLCLCRAPIRVSPEFIERMAKSWPKATSLEVLGGYGHSTVGMAVEDLLPFARHCPDLEFLAINVTHSRLAADSPLHHIQERLPLPHLGLRTLKIDGKYLLKGAEEAIATVLARVFPNIYVKGWNSREKIWETMFNNLLDSKLSATLKV